MKTKFLSLVKIAISLAFIALLLWTRRDSLDSVASVIKNININFFAAGGVLFILAHVILASRLRCLLNASNLPLNNKEAISLTFIGYFFNNFLPTSIGGDFVKAYYASKKTNDKISCFATVFMDRLLGMISLFLLAALTAFLAMRNYSIDNALIWSVYGISAALFIFLLVLWNKKLAKVLLNPFLFITKWVKPNEKIKRAYNIVNNFKNHKTLMIHVFAISIVAQVISFLPIYFWAKGLGVELPLQTVLLTMPVIIIIINVLPSINGLGVRECAIVFFFGPSVGDQNAIALGILWLFLLLVISFIGGLYYAFGSQYRITKEVIS